MVFDLTKPVRVDKAFVVDAAAGAPARLVLDAGRHRSREFLAQDRARRQSSQREAPPVSAPPTVSADPRPLVVLDPGHGGIDTGTKAPNGECEKDIVLDFAKRLRERIEKSGKYPRADDAHRRHFRAACRPCANRAQRRRRAVHLDSRGFAAAQGRRCPGRHGLHALGNRVRSAGGAACRRGKPRRRHRRRRPQGSSRTTSPAS